MSMLNFLPPYILYPIALIVAALISMYSVRKILFITRNHKIYDIPDDTRKIHGAEIPSLGGIGIFIGYILVASLFWPGQLLPVNYFLPSTALLFFTGIYDDLMNMSPSKKLVAQLVASAITVYFADIRIVSLYGMFGIETLPYWASIFITTIGCTLFINAFNFIDGIDGLACVTAILYMAIFGVLFASADLKNLAWLAFSLAGGTAGLLAYNFSPAKIYMGDTGSMLLGFTIFILGVLFVHVYALAPLHGPIAGNSIIHTESGAAMLLLSILFLPVYDALRVFILRASRGRSPLRADRTHLHYYLLDAGCTHSQAVLIIVSINTAIIGIAWLMQAMSLTLALTTMLAFTSLALLVIYRLRQKNQLEHQLSKAAGARRMEV
jgi:UDP-GlcNAc:undecaprenyl-phosphate GlcNAc-1-phosphate transferase